MLTLKLLLLSIVWRPHYYYLGIENVVERDWCNCSSISWHSTSGHVSDKVVCIVMIAFIPVFKGCVENGFYCGRGNKLESGATFECL